MANASLIEQLNDAVEAIIAGRDAPLTVADAGVAALARVAAELRDLPRLDFKTRLRNELEKSVSNTKIAVNPIREGFHTITPYLIVQGAADLIDFVKRAFGAEEVYRGTGTAGGIHAEVRIEDTGPGVPVDFLPHIFERFSQADGSSTRKHGGLGLGLAIVRHLVELHGGTVSAANSSEKGGARLTIRLPATMS